MWKKIHLKVCLGTEGDIEKSKGSDEPHDLFSVLSHSLLPKHLSRFWKRTSGPRHLGQLLCCLRRFQRLGLYTRCFLLLALACLFITLCRFIQFSEPVTTSKQQLSWVLHEDCVAEDCHLREPLPFSKLSPNLLLVFIHASAWRRDRRDAIRKTWLSGLNNQPNSPIQFRFIIGGEKLSSSKLQEVMQEASAHKDILLFPTVTDSLHSLSKRTLFSLNYADKWLNYQYILKCDDDSFVDVRRIATELETRESQRPLYWGYMTGWNYVYHTGQYSEFNWDICDRYITYALGGGYILSSEVVRILAVTSDHLKMYKCEDVSLGAWLAPYSVEYKHDSRFNTNSQSRGCKDPYLISHKVSPEQMLAYQESLVLEGKMCSWRTYSYGSRGYIYNWTAPRTTECCKYNSFVP